jgi:hypothetical protein
MESGSVRDMSCQEFWDTMPELTGSDAAADHVRECSLCAALLERQSELANGLRAAASSSKHIEAPARLEARLLTAFRSYNGITAQPRRRSWPDVLVWASAIAAVLTVALFLVRSTQPQPHPAQRRAPAGLELAMETNDDSAYQDDGFIPLPNVARLDANEAVSLVRVELPRSAMIAVGYAVSEERASEPVEAEVVLGADGLAHAVRFLDE